MRIVICVAMLAQALSVAAQVCTLSAVATVRKAQATPKPFCTKFLKGQKTKSPIKGLDAAAVSKACYCILSPAKTSTSTSTTTKTESVTVIGSQVTITREFNSTVFQTKTVNVTTTVFPSSCGNGSLPASTSSVSSQSTSTSALSSSLTMMTTTYTSTSSSTPKATAYSAGCIDSNVVYVQVRLPSPTSPNDPITSHAPINNTYLLGPSDVTQETNATFLGFYNPNFAPRRFVPDDTGDLLEKQADDSINSQSGHYFTRYVKYTNSTKREIDNMNPDTGRIVVATIQQGSDWSEYNQRILNTTVGAELEWRNSETFEFSRFIMTYQSGYAMFTNNSLAWQRSKLWGLQGAKFFLVGGC
ncbi:Hypothetical protein D9617_1g086750 [Elsinoe fawcettii]|nr:Hypothetical protein D9617_1g086750 [Elsinoe fawcettii]